MFTFDLPGAESPTSSNGTARITAESIKLEVASIAAGNVDMDLPGFVLWYARTTGVARHGGSQPLVQI